MGRHMRHARHVRHAKRTPSRMEQLAKNMKRRGASPSESEPEAETEAVVPDGAPYDPVTVPVRDLADALAEIDDPDAVRALKSADPRVSAERHYDARLEELDG